MRRGIDGRLVDARRRSGLQPPRRKAERAAAPPRARSPALRRSGLRPARRRRGRILPPRNVPVASTTPARAEALAAGTDDAADRARFDDEILDQPAHDREIRLRAQLARAPRARRPACPSAARSARTAGPLLSLRKRACRLQRSAKRPISPPSASISRTSCPFALPPIDGLHGSVQMFSGSPVTSSVVAPKRAAASAASTPACPPPTTMTAASSRVTDAQPRSRRHLRRCRAEYVRRALRRRGGRCLRQMCAQPERQRDHHDSEDDGVGGDDPDDRQRCDTRMPDHQNAEENRADAGDDQQPFVRNRLAQLNRRRRSRECR